LTGSKQIPIIRFDHTLSEKKCGFWTVSNFAETLALNVFINDEEADKINQYIERYKRKEINEEDFKAVVGDMTRLINDTNEMVDIENFISECSFLHNRGSL